MYFFAAGTITKPDQIGPHVDDENRVLNELRNAGVVKTAFRRLKGGVVSIVEGPTLEDVQAQMARLPFVALGLMTFEYDEVVEL